MAQFQSPKHTFSVHVGSRKLQNNAIEKTASMHTDEKAGILQAQRVWANTLEKMMRVTFKLASVSSPSYPCSAHYTGPSELPKL